MRQSKPAPPAAGDPARAGRVSALLLAVLSLGSVAGLAGETSEFAKAMAAYQDRQLDEALRHAERAVREEPGHVDAHLLLGELYYLRQDLAQAQRSWERALALAPSRQEIRQRLEKLKQEMPVEQRLARSDTHPFVVRHASGEVPVEMGGLKQLLRDAHRKIGQQLEYFPDHPITVILYPPGEFQRVKGVSHQVAGLYDGKIRLPLERGRLSGQELERVLWHEYTHAVVHDLSKGSCPLWLNEGIATSQENRVRPVELSLARSAHREGTLPSWDQLLSVGQGLDANAPLYYQVSYLLVDYLTGRWGWRDLVRLLQRLGQGYPIPDALRATYRTDPALLEKQWRDWLRRRL